MMKKKNIILVLILVLIIIAVWYISGYFVYTHFERDKGTIGDLFSPINALFAGLAFCGITLTIYLQQKELSLQRQELINTREIFHRQKFENTFFQLTHTQQTITGALHHEFAIVTTTNGQEKRKEVKIDGRKLFWSIMIDFKEMHTYILGLGKGGHNYVNDNLDTQMRRRFHEYEINPEFSYDVKGVYKSINLKDEEQVTKFLFSKINTSFSDDLSHYFKHLYKILEYIEESEKQELGLMAQNSAKAEIKERFQKYADFLQAQLSNPELAMIYYDSLTDLDRKTLMKKYNFFQTLPLTSLISVSHASWHDESIRAK